MSSPLKLYHHILEMLKPMKEQGRKETMKTLALLMTGIFLSRDVRLSHIARHVPLPSQQDSVVQRMRRWLKNPRLDERTFYDPIARGFLYSLRHMRLRIQIDRTLIEDRFNVLTLTLYWRKRALPLVWQVLAHQGSSGYHDWVELLGHLATLLPSNAQVILLGDREFGTADMMDLIRWHGWDYCLRVKGDQLVWCAQSQQWRELRTLTPSQGQIAFLSDVLFTKTHHYRTHFALAFDHPDDPCLIATNRPPSYRTLQEYARRFGCEPLFSDLKKRGFHLERSQLRHAQRFSRLLLVLALLVIWFVGVARRLKVSRPLADFVCPTHLRRYSCFQIGYRWLTRRLALGRSLLPDAHYRFGQLL